MRLLASLCLVSVCVVSQVAWSSEPSRCTAPPLERHVSSFPPPALPSRCPPSDTKATTNTTTSTVDRGVVGNALRHFVKGALSPDGFMSLQDKIQTLRAQGGRKYALNMARSYGDTELHSLISSAVEAAKASSDAPFLKNLELNYSYSFGDTKTWLVETSTLFPLWQRKNNLLFSQIHLLYTEKRPTINLGVGDRYINTSKTFLVGVNGFFDYDFKGKDSRASLGLEGMTRSFKVAANFYRRLSDWKVSPFQNDKSVLFKERPANGYDVRLRGYLPVYPQLSATARFFQWYGDKVNLFSLDDKEKGTKDPRGYAVGVAYRPNSLMNLALEYAHGIGNDQKTTKITAGLHYQFGVPFKQQLALGSTPLTDVTSHLYDKVERENKIILETQESLGIALDKKDGYTVFVPQRAGSSVSPLIITATVTGKEASKATLTFTSDPFLHSHLSLSNKKLTLKVSKKEVPNGAYGTHYPITLTAKAGDDTVSKATYITFKKVTRLRSGEDGGTFQPRVYFYKKLKRNLKFNLQMHMGTSTDSINLTVKGDVPGSHVMATSSVLLVPEIRDYGSVGDITVCASKATDDEGHRHYSCTVSKVNVHGGSGRPTWSAVPFRFDDVSPVGNPHHLIVASDVWRNKVCERMAEMSGGIRDGSVEPTAPCIIVEDIGKQELPAKLPDIYPHYHAIFTIHSNLQNVPLASRLHIDGVHPLIHGKTDLQLLAGWYTVLFVVPTSVNFSVDQINQSGKGKELHYCINTKNSAVPHLKCAVAQKGTSGFHIPYHFWDTESHGHKKHKLFLFSEQTSNSLCTQELKKGPYKGADIQGVPIQAPCLIVEDWGSTRPHEGQSPWWGDTAEVKIEDTRFRNKKGTLTFTRVSPEPSFVPDFVRPAGAPMRLNPLHLNFNHSTPKYLHFSSRSFPRLMKITYKGNKVGATIPIICVGLNPSSLYVDKCYPSGTTKIMFRLNPAIHAHSIRIMSQDVTSLGWALSHACRRRILGLQGNVKSCVIIRDVPASSP